MMSEPEAASTPSSAQPSTKSYFSYPVSHVVSGLYRRLTEPDRVPSSKAPPPPSLDVHDGVYTPPQRTASPFQPPPLTPLTLKTGSASSSSVILTRALAEEIRLLVPPRLQLVESWSLAYSLEEDGVSLTTLYNKCASRSIPKSSSFILVIKDAAGGVSLPPPQNLRINTHIILSRSSAPTLPTLPAPSPPSTAQANASSGAPPSFPPPPSSHSSLLPPQPRNPPLSTSEAPPSPVPHPLHHHHRIPTTTTASPHPPTISFPSIIQPPLPQPPHLRSLIIQQMDP